MDLTKPHPTCAKQNYPALMVDEVDEVIAHYMGGTALSDLNPSIETIAGWTRDNNPDILSCAYGALIYQDGSSVVARGLHQGAHCRGHNAHTIGIAFVIGGGQAPTEAAILEFCRVAREYRKYFPRIRAVNPHSMRFKTECCGYMVSMDRLRQGSLAPVETEWEKFIKSRYDVLVRAGKMENPEYWYNTMYQLELESELIERYLRKDADYTERVEAELATLRARVAELEDQI